MCFVFFMKGKKRTQYFFSFSSSFLFLLFFLFLFLFRSLPLALRLFPIPLSSLFLFPYLLLTFFSPFLFFFHPLFSSSSLSPSLNSYTPFPILPFPSPLSRLPERSLRISAARSFQQAAKPKSVSCKAQRIESPIPVWEKKKKKLLNMENSEENFSEMDLKFQKRENTTGISLFDNFL